MASTALINEPNSADGDPIAVMASFWTHWMEQSSRGTQALLEMFQAAGDPQQIQKRWLDAVAASIESFMRTPAFMELTKTNLKVVTDLKGMQDSVVQDVARQVGAPTAADIMGLYERIKSTEQVILRHLEKIDDRLKALETRH